MTGTPIAVEAEVIRDAGAWMVNLVFWYADGMDERRVGPYLSEEAARTAMRWMIWAARRDVRPPDGLDTRDIPR